MRAIARARKSVKRINGSIAPFAAAATGLVGISEVSQLENPTAVAPAATELAASAAPGGSAGRMVISRDSHENTAIASGIAKIVAPVSIARNTVSVRPPLRPIIEMSDTEATPVISSETTSGITVIRIAFTQSVPIGATASATAIRVGFCEIEIAMPPARPAASAARTRVPSFRSAPYIMRSPPLMSIDAPVI